MKVALMFDFKVSQNRHGVWIAPVVLALILLAVRAPETFTRPQFLAEDGTLFFRDALIHGPASLIYSHAGNLHLIPRLATVFAVPFPAGSAPALLAAFSVVLMLWTAATIATSRMPYAPLMACLLMLVPHDGIIFGSMTHAQWVLAPGLAVIAATPSPEGRGAQINQLVFAALAGLTGPCAFVALLPICLRLFFHRDKHAWHLAAIIVGAAAVQFYVYATQYVPYRGDARYLHMAVAAADRWFGQMANGVRSTAHEHYVLAGLVAVTTAASLLLPGRRVLFLCLGMAAGAMLVGGITRFAPGISHYFDHIFSGDRYFYLPRLVTMWAAALLLIEGGPVLRALAAVCVLVVTLNFYGWQRVSFPYLQWREEAWKIDRNEPVDIAIHPNGWRVTVPARR